MGKSDGTAIGSNSPGNLRRLHLLLCSPRRLRQSPAHLPRSDKILCLLFPPRRAASQALSGSCVLSSSSAHGLHLCTWTTQRRVSLRHRMRVRSRCQNAASLSIGSRVKAHHLLALPAISQSPHPINLESLLCHVVVSPIPTSPLNGRSNSQNVSTLSSSSSFTQRLSSECLTAHYPGW